MSRSIEGRLNRLRAGLICTVVAALGTIFFVVEAARFGYQLPPRSLLVIVLGEVVPFCFFVWQLMRLKKARANQP